MGTLVFVHIGAAAAGATDQRRHEKHGYQSDKSFLIHISAITTKKNIYCVQEASDTVSCPTQNRTNTVSSPTVVGVDRELVGS